MSEETITQEETKVFDVRKPFIVEIISGKKRTCSLRYPTDAQWTKRAGHQKIKRVELGRGKRKASYTHMEEFDEVLFKSLLTETPADEFDEFEANLCIERLRKAEIIEQRAISDDRIEFQLEVFGGVVVTVIVRQPRRRQIVEYSRGAVNVIGSDKGTESTVALDQTTVLFDAIFDSSTGYADGSQIPITHKDVIAVALVSSPDPE